MSEKGKNNNLEGFEGFEEINSESIDFFGETKEQNDDDIFEEKTEVQAQVDAGKGEEDDSKTKVVEKDDDDETVVSAEEKKIVDDIFSDDDEGEGAAAFSDDDASSKTKEKKPVKASPIATVEYLKEKGLIDYELEDDEELTEEGAEAILEDDFDERVGSRLEELFEGFPPVLKQLNSIAANGGNINEFLGSVISNQTKGLSETMDLEQESNQELVTRAMLKKEGYDEEYIDFQVQSAKDSGKMKQISQVHYNKWKGEKDAENKLKVEQAEKQKAAEKERRRSLKVDVKNFLEKEENVKGLKISKRDKTKLPAYMTDQNVPLEDGRRVTQMTYDLNKALLDNDTAVVLAKLLSSGFDFKTIVAQAETKVVKKVKENITRTKKKPSGSGRQGSSQSKTLADYF